MLCLWNDKSKRNQSCGLIISAFILCLILQESVLVSAGHDWNGYSWYMDASKMENGKLVVSVANCGYNGHLSNVIASWNDMEYCFTVPFVNQEVCVFQGWKANALKLVQVECSNAANGGDGMITTYAENFGATGWYGLATVYTASGTNYITQAKAELNNYYSLTSDQWRHVACQELGHTFGLAHQSENPSVDTDSCMDYHTGLDNPIPNFHDFELINQKYVSSSSRRRMLDVVFAKLNNKGKGKGKGKAEAEAEAKGKGKPNGNGNGNGNLKGPKGVKIGKDLYLDHSPDGKYDIYRFYNFVSETETSN